MLPTEQPEFVRLIQRTMAEYLKAPSAAELEAWWDVCRSLSLASIESAMKAHAVDPEDGKRAPRPIDIKRRLVTRRPSDAPDFKTVDEDSPRMRAYRQACISSPAVVNTAHAIALKLGNRPWPSDADRFHAAMPKRKEAA